MPLAAGVTLKVVTGVPVESRMVTLRLEVPAGAFTARKENSS